MDDNTPFSSFDPQSIDGIVSLPPKRHTTRKLTREGHPISSRDFYSYSQSVVLFSEEEQEPSNLVQRSEVIVYSTSSCNVCTML